MNLVIEIVVDLGLSASNHMRMRGDHGVSSSILLWYYVPGRVLTANHNQGSHGNLATKKSCHCHVTILTI